MARRGGKIGEQPLLARTMEFALWAQQQPRGVLAIDAIRARFKIHESTAFRWRAEYLRARRRLIEARATA